MVRSKKLTEVPPTIGLPAIGCFRMFGTLQNRGMENKFTFLETIYFSWNESMLSNDRFNF